MRNSVPAEESAPLHPLLLAGKWLVADLLSTLAFIGLYSVNHDLLVAIGVSVAVGLGQAIYFRLRRIPIDALQWLVLGVVIVFGGASLVTHNPRFAILQPSLIYGAIGCVMLRPGWQNRYLPPIARARAGDVCFAFGYVWSGLMFLTAAINLVLALRASLWTVAWFLSLFPLGSKIALVLVQYGVTRFVVRRRVRAGQASQASAA